MTCSEDVRRQALECCERGDCDNCTLWGVPGCMECFVNICDTCKLNPPHISKCFNNTGFCIHFPYTLAKEFNQIEDCYVLGNETSEV